MKDNLVGGRCGYRKQVRPQAPSSQCTARGQAFREVQHRHRQRTAEAAAAWAGCATAAPLSPKGAAGGGAVLPRVSRRRAAGPKVGQKGVSLPPVTAYFLVSEAESLGLQRTAFSRGISGFDYGDCVEVKVFEFSQDNGIQMLSMTLFPPLRPSDAECSSNPCEWVSCQILIAKRGRFWCLSSFKGWSGDRLLSDLRKLKGL